MRSVGEHRALELKTAIISSSQGVGFRCFSSDCCNYTFYDLLELLQRRTGVEFDADDDFGVMERMGAEIL